MASTGRIERMPLAVMLPPLHAVVGEEEVDAQSTLRMVPAPPLRTFRNEAPGRTPAACA